jgi:phosphoglycolate phosphatase
LATIGCNGVVFENIQAIIFDKDGTLANSEAFLRNLAQKRARLIDAQIPGVQEPLLMAFGVEADRLNPAGLMAIGSRLENEIAAAAYIAETGRGWIQALEIARSAFSEADEAIQRNLHRKAEQTPPLKGAVELLQWLSSVGLKLGILSSDSTEQVQDFVENYSLESYFHCLLGTTGYPNKSDPQLLQQLMAKLETSPEQILMVGDAEIDLQIARSGGLAGCVAMTGGWSTPVSLVGADAVALGLHEIKILK